VYEDDSKKKAGSLINDAFVGAVIRQESGGRAGALSPKGAVGLMQVMPKTKDWIAKELLGVDPKDYDMKNERDNRLFGTTYLKWLETYWQKKDAPNDLLGNLVLASYNSGQGTISRIVNEVGYDWDRIRPKLYKETKGYVDNISQNLRSQTKATA